MEKLSQLHSGLDHLTLSLEQIDALLTLIQTTELTEIKLDTLFNSLGAISVLVENTKIHCEKLFIEFEKLE